MWKLIWIHPEAVDNPHTDRINGQGILLEVPVHSCVGEKCEKLLYNHYRNVLQETAVRLPVIDNIFYADSSTEDYYDVRQLLLDCVINLESPFYECGASPSQHSVVLINENLRVMFELTDDPEQYLTIKTVCPERVLSSLNGIYDFEENTR